MVISPPSLKFLFFQPESELLRKVDLEIPFPHLVPYIDFILKLFNKTASHSNNMDNPPSFLPLIYILIFVPL